MPTFVLILAVTVALLWLVQLVLAWLIVRRVTPTSSLAAPAPEKWPRLSILVPARDEAFDIEAALTSKLQTTYPEVELIAINDRSVDATPQIIDTIAAADPRVRAVHIEALPEGWLGKLHAMQRGLDVATGEWVLFSDADVHIEKGVLEKLISVAEAERLDMIAVFPRMHSVNLWLDATLGSMLRVLALSGRAWRANDERSPVGVGVGAFNLVRRSKLEETRAIEELKMEVADDVALGALLKQSGARCRFYVGRFDVHLVFLDSWRAALRSTDKGGGMLGYSLLAALAISAGPLLIDVVIPIAGIAAGGVAAIAGASALFIATLTHFLLINHFRGPRVGAFTWPFGHLLNSVLTLHAGLKAWRNQGIYWRDTFYSRETLEAGRRLKLSSLRVERKVMG
jgi:hypothetical protein